MCKSARDGVAPYRVGMKAARWLMGDGEKSAFLSKNSSAVTRNHVERHAKLRVFLPVCAVRECVKAILD